ncbi:hypothetical protein BJY04DRAFT_179704 [Aspergillus karnatakaensis]|uniref:uncharacterized protein n=1 Tax=Aspergillus karnatakaensis TaxID=1810916 RepID=UPI003CCD5415
MSSSLSSSSVVSTITTTFVPQQGQNEVVGFYNVGGVVETAICASDYEFLTSSTHGICCHTASRDACMYDNRCSGSMVFYEDGTSATCSNNNLCVETTLFEQETSAAWSVVMNWCMAESVPTSLYWTITGLQLTLVPADSTATTTSSDPEETETLSTPDSDTTTPTNTNALPTRTDIPDSQLDDGGDDGGGTNVGAIAGGVVGGVAGLVLIVLAVWFVMRRQKKKDAEVREIGGGYTEPEPK